MLHIAAKVIYSFGVHYGHLGFLRGGNPRGKKSANLGERFVACNFRDTVKESLRGDASDENLLLGVGHRNRKTAPIRTNVTSESAICTTRWLSAITSSCWESFREEGLFRLICLANSPRDLEQLFHL